ncbi:hypothetical protein [Pseudolactococcus raffinolactis]|uniref:hypothetical protein n=1 Tax=Pseudolactococcus raffinolactis TaxID=1366 RepID=UPI00110812BF|nr:hypothetical protein [Lactococcus raffinolactis]TLQ11455.1 hypothetical protein FEZ46_11585 [Lactococcus raffinolactis]
MASGIGKTVSLSCTIPVPSNAGIPTFVVSEVADNGGVVICSLPGLEMMSQSAALTGMEKVINNKMMIVRKIGLLLIFRI